MQIKDKTAKLKIYYDESAENPRNWENIGTMVCWSKKYLFGDRHDYSDPQDFLESEEAKKAYVILPVYLYDHSTQALSNKPFTGRAVYANWDSGQIGYIYATKNRFKELTGMEATEENKKAANRMLTAETELYSSYIECECYGFMIEDLQGNTIENCGGFYGNLSEVIPQMQRYVSDDHKQLFTRMQNYVGALQAVMA